MTLAHRLRYLRQSLLAPLAVGVLACGTIPDFDPSVGSSRGPTEGPSTEGPSSGGSAGPTDSGLVDGSSSGSSGASTGTGTTGEPEPEIECQQNSCYVECTRELALENGQGEACTCTSAASPPDRIACDMPSGCGYNDYVCIMEGLRDGLVGRYSWEYVEPDVGGQYVTIELLEPGLARARVGNFDELACCGVQSKDETLYYFPFEIPAADDPYWDECLALAGEIELSDFTPDCMQPDTLRLSCGGALLTECPG